MIYEKIIDYCRKNSLSISSFEKMCCIGNGTIGGWKDGKSKPSLQTLEKISEVTRIPISEWL